MYTLQTKDISSYTRVSSYVVRRVPPHIRGPILVLDLLRQVFSEENQPPVKVTVEMKLIQRMDPTLPR